jgi:hypothetical protein
MRISLGRRVTYFRGKQSISEAYGCSSLAFVLVAGTRFIIQHKWFGNCFQFYYVYLMLCYVHAILCWTWLWLEPWIMGLFSDYVNHELPPFWRYRNSHYKPEIPDCPRICMDLPSVCNITGILEVTWMLSYGTGPVAVYLGNSYVQSWLTKLSAFFLLLLWASCVFY